MATRTARIEIRAEVARERRIRRAAELSHQSVSAFVLDAAADRAEDVIAAASTTTVPPAWFDRLWSALDSPPKPNRRLRALATRARTVTQK